jgi:NitT/TauT family transport system permease protein
MFGKIKNIYKKTIVIILFFVFWDLSSRLGFVDQWILPTVTDVFKALGKLIASGELLKHVLKSLGRSGSGFLLAVIIGNVLGVLMGWFSKVEEYLDPLFQVFRNTSVLALFPVFLLIFGIGESAKIAIVCWSSLWACLLNTINGVKTVDPVLIKAARSMGMTTFQLLRKVVLPAAFPEILTGIRLSASIALIILVASEMLGANSGLGYYIFYSQQLFNQANMYAGILTIAVLGVIVNFLLVQLEKKTVGWKMHEK